MALGELEIVLAETARQLDEAQVEVERLTKERDDAVKLASAAIQALPEKQREIIIAEMKARVANEVESP